MNFRSITKPVTIIASFVALFMIIPASIAIYKSETDAAIAFISVISGTLILSFIILFISRNWGSGRLSIKEGFFMVVSGWTISSLIGALPFYISGSVDTFTDAFFETASGFTTTGATILTSIESLPASILFWRSLTHWLGGMGIVVLAVAILPVLGIGGLQLLKAEAPGPTVDKITPRISETAKVLWMIYLGMTIAQTLLLRLAGMSYFDALTHTFGTLATGGFSPRNDSVGAFNSAHIDAIITIFMVLAGINFTIHYRFLTGRTKNILKNTELKAYLLILAVTTLLITSDLYKTTYHTLSQSFRYASFQAASIMTTTGYGTSDFIKWPAFSQIILFALMFFGACSGSTGGGIKVVRLVTLFKLGLHEMKYLLHPKAVMPLWMDGKVMKKDMVYSIAAFFFLYIFMLVLTALVCASSGIDITTSFTTALATVGNIGPGFGMIGPAENYAFYSDYVKWFLSFAMVVGRLEVYTVLIIFTKSFWTR
jgi:trk system potassium uptake protein